MTQDEIIRMAREADIEVAHMNKPMTDTEVKQAWLERFAALVAAHEREKLAEQEPVGEVVMESMGVGDAQIVRFRMNGRIPPVGTKLYAAPVRTKDLTDDEIADCGDFAGVITLTDLQFARAVIAADREKNK